MIDIAERLVDATAVWIHPCHIPLKIDPITRREQCSAVHDKNKEVAPEEKSSNVTIQVCAIEYKKVNLVHSLLQFVAVATTFASNAKFVLVADWYVILRVCIMTMIVDSDFCINICPSSSVG